MNLIHRVLHLLNWNVGSPHTWWNGNRLMVGFKCNGCGRLEGIEDITNRVDKDIQEYLDERERCRALNNNVGTANMPPTGASTPLTGN